MDLRVNEKGDSVCVWDSYEKSKQMRRSLFQGMFRNPDNTHLVFSEKIVLPKAGDNMLDYNGRFYRIIEILEVRDHKGIYKNEANRQKISRVKAIPIIFI